MERRLSYRCRSQRLAVLKIGRRKVSVTIIDESASGFGVLIDGSCRCEIGQELSLKISSGWTPTCVTNVAYVIKAADVDRGGTREDELQTRLGLTRLDLDQQLKPKGPGVLWFVPSKLTVRYPFLATVGIALGAFATGCGFVWVLERLNTHVIVATLDPHGSTSAEEFVTTPRRLVGKRTEGPGVASEDRSPIAHTPRRTDVLIRSQPALLLKPEVVQLLALDPKQYADLRRIMKERDEIGSIDGTGSQASDLRIGRAALDVLNDKQREQWILLQLSDSSPDLKI